MVRPFYYDGYEWSVDIGGAVLGIKLSDRTQRCYLLPEWTIGELRKLIRQHFNM